jgi:hypothetical protein
MAVRGLASHWLDPAYADAEAVVVLHVQGPLSAVAADSLAAGAAAARDCGAATCDANAPGAALEVARLPVHRLVLTAVSLKCTPDC